MLATLNDSTILRLRVKGSDLDPLALRGRLQNLLGEISFAPRLPPSATLFIRKLHDPIPGLLQLDAAYPRAPEAWRQAFNTRFEQLVSSAVRPAHGLVADSAESVVFYDYSELLASLTADWCSGYATTRWWWQGLIKRGDVSEVIKQYWREKIEYVPAALEQLVKRNALVEFVSRLSDDEARQLVQRLINVFALHEMRRVVKFHSPITQITETDFSPAPRSIEEMRVRSLMPWRHTVAESDAPRLGPAQQLFVGVGLMIRRAPVRVRSAQFAEEVEQWHERVISVSCVRETVASRTSESRVDVVPPQTSASTFIVADDIVAAPIASVSDSTTEVPLAFVTDNTKREQVKLGNAVFSYEEPVVISEAHVEQQAIVIPEKPLVQSTPETEPPPQASASASEPLDASTIETELGGLFYLVNLAIFLNIYSDFTSPVESFTTDLSIWDFVMIVGAELIGGQDFDDPIWTGLQDLQDLQDEHLVNPANPVNPVNKPTWLADLLPFLRTRLRQGLGISTEVDLPQILLRHHAKVIITATHLDVFFALAEHPIEIRLSGLDRNPGWVPAAGKFIAFHYD